jgi:hypothetical protein
VKEAFKDDIFNVRGSVESAESATRQVSRLRAVEKSLTNEPVNYKLLSQLEPEISHRYG